MACSQYMLATLLLKIYTPMIAVGYMDGTDIKLPPHDPQVFPADAYRAQNVSDRAIDFSLSIPWMVPGRHFLPGYTWSLNWSDKWAPEISRIPDMFDMPETAEDLMVDCSDDETSWCYQPLRLHQVPLTYGSERPAVLLIIDVVNSRFSPYLKFAMKADNSYSDRRGMLQLRSGMLAEL